jgi:hypothetical protein
MKLTRLFMPAAVALAITMAAGPVLAQSNGNNRQRRSQDRSDRVTGSAGQSRDSNGNRSGRGWAVRRAEPRADAYRGSGAAQGNWSSNNRGYNAGQYNSGRGNSGGNNSWRGGNGSYDNRRYDSGQYSNRGYSGLGGYDRSSWRSRVRLGLGISIFAGRSFGFRFDSGWRPSYNYRYPLRTGIAYGGMSFLLDPDQAEVYIDGQFVGIARDFGGQPVPVAVGFHRIELNAPGFEPVAFDITVLPGQVIPYRGSLYPTY